MSRVFYDRVRDLPRNFAEELSEFKGHKTVVHNGVKYEKVAVVFEKHHAIWKIGRLFKFLVYKIAGLCSKKCKKLCNRARIELKTGEEKVKSLYVKINVQQDINPAELPKPSIPGQVEIPKANGPIPELPMELYNILLDGMTTPELAKLTTQMKMTEKSNSDWLNMANTILVKRFKESNNHREDIFVALGLETLKYENIDLSLIDHKFMARVLELDGVQPKIILDLLDNRNELITFLRENFMNLSPEAKEKVINNLNPIRVIDSREVANLDTTQLLSLLFALYVFFRAYGKDASADFIFERIEPYEHMTGLPRDKFFRTFFHFEHLINELKKDDYSRNVINVKKGLISQALSTWISGKASVVFEKIFVQMIDLYLSRLQLTENPRLLLRLKNSYVCNMMVNALKEEKISLERLFDRKYSL